MEPEFMWFKERCIECRDCQNVCVNGAISFESSSLLLDYNKCNICGACVKVCTPQAIELIGKKKTVDQVMNEIAKDIIFYDESGGGVTFSGGEPLMQPDFLYILLKKCKGRRIHTALDTSGYADPDVLLKIRKYVDLFLYDVKVINDSKHIKFTGVSNKIILKNLRNLSSNRRKIIIRFPLIPSVNDDEKDILDLGLFVSSLKNVNELDILPYHKVGIEKFQRLLKPKDLFFESQPPSTEKLAEIREKLEKFGLKVKIGG